MGPNPRDRSRANFDWFAFARCQTAQVDMHPIDGSGVAEAKRVCEQCPVRSQCLEYALEYHEDHGVWGGKSERERRKLIKQRRLLRATA